MPFFPPTIVAAGEAPAYLAGLVALVLGAALVAYVGTRIKLVPIVGFLLTGVAIGPNALGLVDDLESVRAAADVGVLLLLFTIGLEFRLSRLRDVRGDLLIGGGLQVGLTTAVVTGLLLLAGVDTAAAVFTGLLVSLSSTAIVFKLLSDRGEMGSRHGRLAVAVLLFQDLAIVAMVLAVPAIGGEQGSASQIGLALLKAAAMIAAVLIFARRMLPPVLERVARTCSPEIFLLSIVAICLGTAYACALAGLSVSLGAFLAGLVVSESRFRSQALGEVLPLQIVFSAVFFVSVGMLVDLGFVWENLPVLAGMVAAVLVVKLLTTTAAALALRRTLPVAVASGLMLAQVGEFSFVLAQVGSEAGLSPAGLGAAGTQGFIAATVLLMALTPTMSTVGTRLVERTTPPPVKPELAGRQEPVPGAGIAEELDDHVIVAGYGRAARGIAEALDRAGIPLIVVTLSPDGSAEAHARGLPVLLGDPARQLTLEEAGLRRARCVVIPDDEPGDAEHVMSVVRTMRDDVDILVRVRYAADADGLLEAGAGAVVAEEVEAGASLAAGVMRDYGLNEHRIRTHLDDLRSVHSPSSPRAAPLVKVAPARRVDTDHEVDVDVPALCEHAGQVRPVVPSAPGCEECLRDGDSWVELRLCLTCGHVGCCDSSPNRHARFHAEHTDHQLVRSAEPGQSWVYCFADDLQLAGQTEAVAESSSS